MMRLLGLLSDWFRFVDVTTLRLHPNSLNGDATKCAILRAKRQKLRPDATKKRPWIANRNREGAVLAKARQYSVGKLTYLRAGPGKNG
jgi:hypothetical protein